MGIREDQKIKRKNEIIGVAIELFVTRGYAGTKITDIAEKASMSTGLLFHYFKNKETLYKEIVEMGLAGTKMPVSYDKGIAIDCFKLFLEGLFTYMKAQPVIAKIFILMAEAQRSESTPKEIREIALKVTTVADFVEIVKRGQEEGNIKKGDPLAISGVFWSTVQGVAEQYAFHPEIPLPNTDWILDIIRS